MAPISIFNILSTASLFPNLTIPARSLKHEAFAPSAMTTPIHNSDQPWYQYALADWVRNGLLNQAEVRRLCVASNTHFTFPGGPYAGRDKLPNLAIREASTRLPSIVFEAGWSELLSQLHGDMREWITGGHGLVEVVIIINWTKLANDRVRGEVEVWAPNNQGVGQLRETHQVFPAPANAATQVIGLSLREIFGYNSLHINSLRAAARRELWLMNLTPA